MPPATMLPPSDQGLTMGQSSGFSIPSHGMRRKTPSELRQEQLKRNVRLRRNSDGEPSVLPSQGSTADLKKISPRLIDTRVADIFAATKPHERPKFSLAKQMEEVGQNSPMSPCGIRAVDREAETLASNELPRIDQMNCSLESRATSHGVQAAHILDRFRDVTEMSTAVPPQVAAGAALNMVEALKMMAPITGQSFKDSAKLADLANAPHTLYRMDAIDCKSRTPPVDLSLKLSARFLSADSLHWCHRTTPGDEVEGLGKFVKKFKERSQENLDCQPEGCTEKQTSQRFGAQFCQALFSYVHPSPQYSVLYDMVLTSTTGGRDPQLAGLYQMWEDAFSSLYYMFRYRRCNQFYYCTKQFVVMFVGGDLAGRDKNTSNAYWTRSTRGLRRLLKENGVDFLMPFSSPEGDTTTMEELQELTEFEQLHPGQTRLIEPSAALDNRDISLLVFEGKNVHRLFDFLLNYRFLVGSANAKEFPTLYSPVEFKRAILHAPEVKCKRAEYDSSSKNQLAPNTSGRNKSTSDTEMMYSLELYPIGGYIPPWVIQRVCEVLQESQSTGFEASFNAGPLTEILNVVQTTTHSEAGSSVPNMNSQSKPREVKSTNLKDIAAEIQECRMKVVKQLKFSRGLYGTSVTSFR